MKFLRKAQIGLLFGVICLFIIGLTTYCMILTEIDQENSIKIFERENEVWQILRMRNTTDVFRVPTDDTALVYQIVSILREEGLTHDEIQTALWICWYESKFNPWAIGDNGHSLGLWQINDVHGFSVEERFDVDRSTRITAKMLKEGHWERWSTYKIAIKL